MVFVSVIIAYLLGSISTSTIVSKWFAKIDIRQHGSGNAGATNTLRVLGIKWAIVVLLIDILKGVAAILISWKLGDGQPLYAALSGLAVIIGHNWPVFFGFRGGKGVATSIGVLALILPMPSLYAFIVAAVLLILTRYVSLFSLVFTGLIPFIAWGLHKPMDLVIAAFVIAALSYWRHRANIGRLLSGKESRVFSKKKSS